MERLPQVISAKHSEGYRIALTFDDGVNGTIDFQNFLDGPVFVPLKDPEYFQRFFLEGGTVVWPNGADVVPETLYERVKADQAA